MGQPRASRRRVIAVSSDEDEDEAKPLPPISEDEQVDEDDEPIKKAGRANNGSGGAMGKLKSIRKARDSKPQQPTPTNSSTQEASSQHSPKKAKDSKTKLKAKPGVKEEPKTQAKPIYSFFNAATQRQKSSQPPAQSPPKPSTPHEDAETIDSDDDRTGSLAFSKGSSTAIALQKRKVHQTQPFEDDGTLLPPPTQKFRKASDGSRKPSFSTVVNEDRRPWVERFAPTSLAELAVHKRKVADVRQWFEAAYGGRRQRVLVLKGAAGTGKTATVGLLAREMGFGVMEWKNPAGSDYLTEGSASTAAQFDEFIGRAGRGGGLSLVSSDSRQVKDEESDARDPDEKVSDRKQLLLIEEFPNTFSRTSPVLHSFRSALSQYMASSPLAGHEPTPIVLIVSETLLSTSTAAADSFTVHRLLGPELINHPYLDTIEFNAVAPTILTKALESIVVQEARKSGRRTTPGPLVLKHLAETGDIRSAVSSLQFLCLRGDGESTWSSKVTFTKSKKAKTEPGLTKAEEEALKLISNRESSLGIFHAVGKVVYNKRTEPLPGVGLAQPPPWLPQYRRSKVAETDIERLIDELGTDTSTFVAALHENYVLSCSCSSSEESLDSLNGCIESISDADLLSLDRFSFGTRAFSGSATDSLRQDEMAFQVATRGLLFNLPCPVHRGTPSSGKKSDAHRMFYPASLRLWRKREEVEGVLELLTARAQKGELEGSVTAPRHGGGRESGVAAWKQDASEGTVGAVASTSAKGKMLLDRLPYLARIWESKATSKPASLDQVMSVVRMRDSAPPPTDEEDADDPSLAGQEPGQQWSTDRPEADGTERLRGTKKKVSKRETEGGGLGIPVESRVAKLVLEDDDIVDD